MPSQNLQDAFLNSARKERLPVVIYLTSGVKLSGRVRGFDKYCVVFESNHQEQLIFKHAISTVVAPRPAHPGGPRDSRDEERSDNAPAIRRAANGEPHTSPGIPEDDPDA